MKTARHSIAILLGSLAMSASLGTLADRDGWHGDREHWHGGHDDWREHYRPEPQIEVIVDGLRIGGQDRPAENDAEAESGASICHQAGGTTWSTREIPCEEPTPPERSRVWGTSP